MGQEISTKIERQNKLIDTTQSEIIEPGQKIDVNVIDMKPNTPVNVLLDNIDITQNCIQYTDSTKTSDKKTTGIVTDVNGTVTFRYTFRSNPEFRVGDRRIEVRNATNDTEASGNLTATGLLDFRRDETTLTRTLTGVTDDRVIGSSAGRTTTQNIRTWTVPQRNDNDDRGSRSRDPLAQAFTTDEDNDTFITGVDFYMRVIEELARVRTSDEKKKLITDQYGLKLTETLDEK